LLDRDKEVFANYWHLNNVQEKIRFHVGLEFDKQHQDLLIFDESDALFFDDPGTFDSIVGRNPCICLTATPGDSENTLEVDTLKKLGFKILED